MPDMYRNPYFDSSVWISWIKGEIVDGVDRKDVVEHLLKHAEKGSFLIYTSAMTLAEVHRRGNSIILNDSEDNEILAFFESDFIKLVDVDRITGETANRLCRDKSLYPNGGKGLKPFDALHLACALKAKCDYLLSWDGDFLKTVHPNITINTPEKRGQAFINLG